jgi:hypothetical protein
MFNAATGRAGHWRIKYLDSQRRQKTPSSKQKSKGTPDYQPPPIKQLKMGATLSILMHEETENKCPSASQRGRLIDTRELFRNSSEASSETSTPTCGSNTF